MRSPSTRRSFVYHDRGNHECNREVWIRRKRERGENILRGFVALHGPGNNWDTSVIKPRTRRHRKARGANPTYTHARKPDVFPGAHVTRLYDVAPIRGLWQCRSCPDLGLTPPGYTMSPPFGGYDDAVPAPILRHQAIRCRPVRGWAGRRCPAGRVRGKVASANDDPKVSRSRKDRLPDIEIRKCTP